MNRIQLNKILPKLKDLLLGIVVGLAVLIPGISGGTILFLSNKYRKIIFTIHHAYSTLFRFGKKDNLDKPDYVMLVYVSLGILISVLSFSRLMGILMDNYIYETQFILFGLIFVYSADLLSKIKNKLNNSIFLIIGILIGFFILFMPSISNSNIISIFLSGILSVGSMILPGLSGGSILLIIGTYETTINAINTLDIFYLTIFGLGGIIGLTFAIYVLKIILERFLNKFIIVATGFILGSLLGLVADNLLSQTSSIGFISIFLFLGILAGVILIGTTKYILIKFPLFLIVLILGCGTTDEQNILIPQISNSDIHLRSEDFTKVGFKIVKTYDISELENAEEAVFGWMKDEFKNPRDYELRFYDNHNNAVHSENIIEEIVGENAKVATNQVTWKEGQSDRRVNRRSGTGHRGPGSGKAKYQYYLIHGNAVILCEGLNEEEAIILCNLIIDKTQLVKIQQD